MNEAPGNYPQKASDWADHTCTMDSTPDFENCKGCQQRDELNMSPLTPRARQAQIIRAEFERGPRYAAFAVTGSEPTMLAEGNVQPASGIWLAVCSWCGALVTASQIGREPMSSPAHTAWHKRNAGGFR